MANLGIMFPNRANTPAVLSGGSWVGGSLQFMLNPELAVVARSTTAANINTQFNTDLQASYAIRAVALAAHNFAPGASVRVSLGTSLGGNEVYLGSAVVWDLPTLTTTLTNLGLQSSAVGIDVPTAIVVLPDAYVARYVKVEVFDASNPAGYSQIGRLFIGGGFVPTYNASYGLRDSYIDLSTTDQSESGAPWTIARRRLKEVRFSLDLLGPTEGLIVHEMQRAAGSTEEVLYVPGVASPADIARFGFLGNLRELSGLEYPRYNSRSAGFLIRQKA